MIVLLGVLVVVAGVLVPTMWFDLRNLRNADAAGAEAMAAAKAVAPDLLSYDYRTVEADLARAARHTTGELTRYYKELTTTLASRARAQKIVQTVTVAGVGVERAEADRVEILLFVNTGTVKETPGQDEPRQQFTQNRARFVMVRQDQRWLVADLSTLLGTA
jgi:Mce-associated membrane protein